MFSKISGTSSARAGRTDMVTPLGCGVRVSSATVQVLLGSLYGILHAQRRRAAVTGACVDDRFQPKRLVHVLRDAALDGLKAFERQVRESHALFQSHGDQPAHDVVGL